MAKRSKTLQEMDAIVEEAHMATSRFSWTAQERDRVAEQMIVESSNLVATIQQCNKEMIDRANRLSADLNRFHALWVFEDARSSAAGIEDYGRRAAAAVESLRAQMRLVKEYIRSISQSNAEALMHLSDFCAAIELARIVDEASIVTEIKDFDASLSKYAKA